MKDEDRLSTPYAQDIAWALQSSKRHVYQGTVSADEIQRRRAKNRAARRARKAQRRG